jgi:hypothetical protein
MRKTKAEKLYNELIEAIQCNTEVQWQEDNIMKALLDYLNALKE